MKLRFLVSVLAIAAIFGFSACNNEAPIQLLPMSDEAVLTSMTITSATGELLFSAAANPPVTEPDVSPLPAAIESIEWNQWKVDLYQEDFKTMSFNRASDIVDVRIKTVASARAKTEWGIGDRSTRPAVFTDVRGMPASFGHEDYLYIKVTSEDTKTSNYYRFYARVFNSVTHLADVIIDDKKMEVGEGHGTWEVSASDTGKVALTSLQAVTNGVEIEAVGFDFTSTFRFAKTSDISTEPDFSGSPSVPYQGKSQTFNFADQDYLYVQVTAQNTVDVAYYKFRVSVGRIATIATLELGDGADMEEVMGTGIPSAVWSNVLQGAFGTADQPDEGLIINFALDDPAGHMEYVKVDSLGATPPEAGAFTPIEQSGRLPFFNDKDFLVIKVISEKGLLAEYEEGEMYYNIKINLLAANIMVQPISKVYYYYHDGGTGSRPYSDEVKAAGLDFASPTVFTSDIPAALTVELDRPIKNGSYVWYEANSWYGGMGFDKDGHIAIPNGTQEGTLEPGFEADFSHTERFDEKNNVSLFNGGNQKAQYVVPGRQIPGGSGTFSGTTVEGPVPNINYRPFLPGYSNETHYYWVVITDEDSQYQVTSARGAIVSERDNGKKHFVIDVNNYYGVEGSTAGERIVFKNIIPWTERYTKYKIPIHFPADFDVMDYSILTVGAKFYLADGTEWIQNWTNGWVSFETLTGHIGDYVDGNIDNNILQLYYNLTNQNAQYLIADDAKEPSPGTPLLETPTHFTIEASGDHVQKGFPPLTGYTGDSNSLAYGGNIGDPVAAPSIVGSDLQGWFCGYIEITEFRFESPPRTP